MGNDAPSDSGLPSTPEPSVAATTGASSLSRQMFPLAISTGTQQKQAFFISPPVISEAQKKLYKMAGETSLKSKGAIQVDEIIGDYRESDVLYYFARYKGGIAQKFASQPFCKDHPNLVKEYNRKKAAGTLAPFDPSAHYVHPLSRIRLTRGLQKSVAAVFMGKTESSSDPDSKDQDEESANGTEADDYEDDSSLYPRKSTQSQGKRPLPFSPRKTRSRRVFVVESDQELEEDEEHLSHYPARRSTRIKKGLKVNLYREPHADDNEQTDEGSDDYSLPKPRSNRGKPRKSTRGKASRPAYGYFRDVTELDYDFPSGDEDTSIQCHRDICEKCQKAPAHELFLDFSKRGKIKARRRRTPDDEFEDVEDEGERLAALGGWVRCLKCPVACHWQCLAGTQRDEILKATKDRDRAEWERSRNEVEDASQIPEPRKRPSLNMNQTTEFICNACMKGGFCMGCMEATSVLDHEIPGDRTLSEPDKHTWLGEEMSVKSVGKAGHGELLFRCLTCKRVAHWKHLPRPSHLSPDDRLVQIAQFYTKNWLCADCSSYHYGVDKIIAWRPYPSNAIGSPCSHSETPNYKNSLPREYLVKWVDRGYRRVQWVPHMWLLSTHPGKLKHFLTGGSKVELSKDLDQKEIDGTTPSIFRIGDESRTPPIRPGTNTPSIRGAVPDAERRIPPAWKTIDRILDIYLWNSPQQSKNAKRKSKRKALVIESESDVSDPVEQDSSDSERLLAFDHGEQPSDESMSNISQWEAKTKRSFTVQDIEQVAWAFIKWGDLGYDESTWDSPPRRSDITHPSFERALRRFIESREVVVPKHSLSYCEKFDKRAKDEYRTRHVLKDAADLDLGQDPQLRLMPFQVDGFNWLCNNWWTHQHCILADEMGLGKTVQVASFVGKIVMDFKAFPALIVVPNSTITNWVREFERWAPKLRVVPFYGEAKAREIIKKFELHHETKRVGETGVKYHVLVTTYETLLNPKDFTPVFRNQPRWEVLIIDEGQRLKNDNSLLFKRLNELKSIHRVIMTGTPLNNNIRELFNLMNFLDPNEWNDLENLEKEHEELTEDLVKQLHNRLRPYFLRRIKSEVLQLPPKNEVIVPVSMAPLQKEVYRSILSHNLEILNGLTQPSTSKVNGSTSKGRLNNVLMHLRKCLQHPYLYAEDIEPRGLSLQETHEKLIDGSAKLRLLKSLLPKLKERGHRVLLFSQFTIALDVIEDFLTGEGYKFLRLDGNIKGSERQKGMDEFNKAGSEIFIYLLTTRAGGVGINLFSADTVIVYDPDFNPHQDLQAIARAYRYGQQKTCLVFKLMVKDSAEERIIQVGKKKLVLDHLIVQKMDDEDEAGEDVQSILTYGAQALFDANQGSKDIMYTDQDIEKLVLKTEQEGEQHEQAKDGLSFSFAKIWAADRDSLEEVQDVDQGDSWAQTLQNITLERDKLQIQEVAQSGRGVRRRAAALAKPNAYRDEPLKEMRKRGSSKSDGSAYFGSEVESDGDSDVPSGAYEDASFEPIATKKARISSSTKGSQPSRSSPIGNADRDLHYCGLCARMHGEGPGECVMTDRSENLAEFREMLLLHGDDEPWEQRIAAIEAIDRTLHRRGHLSMIGGQPLHPLRKLQHPIAQSIDVVDNRTRTQIDRGNSVITNATKLEAASSSKSHLAPPTSPAFRPERQSNDATGPLKRPASALPVQEQSKTKKAKLAGSLCRVCGQTFHLVKDCPVVNEGTHSILKAINRLESDLDPQTIGITQVLHKLLYKLKKKEASTLQEIIDISD